MVISPVYNITSFIALFCPKALVLHFLKSDAFAWHCGAPYACAKVLAKHHVGQKKGLVRNLGDVDSSSSSSTV